MPPSSLLARSCAILLLLVATASAPRAAEVALSLGRNDILDRHGDSSFSVGLGAASGPLGHLGPVGFAVGGAMEAADKGRVLGGRGAIAFIPLGALYRIDASVMVGVYDEGNGLDLGFPVEFRSRLGLSRAIAGDWRIGVAIEHKSNAGASDTNPGVETLYATISRAF